MEKNKELTPMMELIEQLKVEIDNCEEQGLQYRGIYLDCKWKAEILLEKEEQFKYNSLKNLTQFELIELKNNCINALEDYDNRDKIKVFKVSLFGSNTYFANHEKALESFNSHVRVYNFEEMILNNPISISTEYMNQAEFSSWVIK